MSDPNEIDWRSPEMEPVRARVNAKIAELIETVMALGTPLEKVPIYRGQVIALNWLLDQLKAPKVYHSE